MKKSVFHVILCVLLLSVLTACSALKDAAEKDSYDFGNDVIPSVKKVLELREVTGVTNSTSNGVKTQEYTYKSITVADDVETYAQYLVDNEGFLCTEPGDPTAGDGEWQFAKNSADEGQAVIMDMKWTDGGYTIIITKGEGSISAK